VSSHHIVRDNQEPALIIANGGACSYELLSQLMEWTPFVVVLDGALQRVLEQEIRFDVWLGDFDSGVEVNFENYPHLSHVEVVKAENQDKTDLQKGLEFLIHRGFTAVNIIWATGRRFDHAMNNVFTVANYSEQLTLNVLDDHSRIFVAPKFFRKWYPKGTNLSLIPCGVCEGIKTVNLDWNLKGETLQLPQKTSASNRVAEDGWVEIAFESGHLLIMECFDHEGY
jgi:thiamine pyrophosphokinase